MFAREPATKSNPPTHDGVVVGSKRIMRVQRTSIEVAVSLDADDATKARALEELKTFALANHVTDAVFREFVEDDRIVFSYDCEMRSTGHDYNSLMYPNIVWVEELVK